MASKQTYECFVCKKAGFPDTRVYLDGKTEDGKTIYKNTDMTPHIHKQPHPSQISHMENSRSEPQPKDESLEWSNLTHEELVSKVLKEYGISEIMDRIQKLESKIDNLNRLVYSQILRQRQKQPAAEDHNNPATYLDNR